MKAKRSLWSAVFVLGLAASSLPAAALTGADILDNMNDDQRGSYLAGTVEMAAFLTNVGGDKERADCIMTWYYDQGGINTIVTTLGSYKDRQVLPVLHVLIKRACGE